MAVPVTLAYSTPCFIYYTWYAFCTNGRRGRSCRWSATTLVPNFEVFNHLECKLSFSEGKDGVMTDWMRMCEGGGWGDKNNLQLYPHVITEFLRAVGATTAHIDGVGQELHILLRHPCASVLQSQTADTPVHKQAVSLLIPGIAIPQAMLRHPSPCS